LMIVSGYGIAQIFLYLNDFSQLHYTASSSLRLCFSVIP